MYYYFEPLMKEGKQEVRHPDEEEWFDFDGEPSRDSVFGKYPILTLHRFEKDPFGAIKSVYAAYNGGSPGSADKVVCLTQIKQLWTAITETMKILEEGK